MDHKAIFNAIYESNKWQNGSGAGSTEVVTRQYRSYIHNFIRSNNVRSVVDIGCGDWQFSKLINWDGIDYKGIDVSDVVLTNTKKYSRAGVKFLELDAVRDDIPSADLVIIKDVMQHWSNDDIIKFLPRLNRFGAALITNGFHQNVMHLLNKDITTGEYRAINLSNSPFNINGHFVYWFTADEPKSIFLWKKS